MSQIRSINDVKSLFQKLVRSFERRTQYGESQVDWVFDVAVTAWHIVDWYAKEANEDIGTTKQRVKKACPELAVCEQICNGAKHLTLTDPKLSPFDITTGVHQTDDLKGIVMNVTPGDTNVDIVLTPLVMVTDRSGTQWEAIELFRKVIAFWQHELH